MTRRAFLVLAFLLTTFTAAQAQAPSKPPRIVGHRGLLRHAPENTLTGFAACMNLRLGFELDIRRSKDGVLVVMHDGDVKRTTNGKGRVGDLTLAEIKKLDAGRWFAADFAGEPVPTLDAVFALLKKMGGADTLVCLDIKEEDEAMESDIVMLAKKHDVLPKVLCIGRAILESRARAKLRAADAKTPVAVLAQKSEDLRQALAEKDADWIYVRFMPTPAEVKAVHAQGKRVFLSGTLSIGNEPENWQRARDAGVDALLTDYPLECQLLWRAGQKK